MRSTSTRPLTDRRALTLIRRRFGEKAFGYYPLWLDGIRHSPTHFVAERLPNGVHNILGHGDSWEEAISSAAGI